MTLPQERIAAVQNETQEGGIITRLCLKPSKPWRKIYRIFSMACESAKLCMHTRDSDQLLRVMFLSRREIKKMAPR